MCVIIVNFDFFYYVRQVFNCGTETYVSYQQICDMVAETVGKAATTKGYNPKVCQHTATHCNTLQHTATHCNTPQYKGL